MDQPHEAAAHGGDDHDHDERLPETALRFSLAGVQLKFSAVMEASGGLTIPAGGMGGSWVVKLPAGRFASVPENEYRSEEHTSELQSRVDLVCRLLLEKKKTTPACNAKCERLRSCDSPT